jgi:hypothetical protein
MLVLFCTLLFVNQGYVLTHKPHTEAQVPSAMSNMATAISGLKQDVQTLMSRSPSGGVIVKPQPQPIHENATSRPYGILTVIEIDSRLDLWVRTSQLYEDASQGVLNSIRPPGDLRTEEEIQRWEASGGLEQMNRMRQDLLKQMNDDCSSIHDQVPPLIAEMIHRKFKMPSRPQPNCLGSLRTFVTAEEGIQQFHDLAGYLGELQTSLKKGIH